jgi:hypothetical protein
VAARHGYATWLGEFAGGSAWYVWMVSGAASAWAFFYVALRVAPTTSAVVKWASIVVVGGIGLMAGLGPLMKGTEQVRAITGATMVAIALYYARLPTSAIKADVAATLGD